MLTPTSESLTAALALRDQRIAERRAAEATLSKALAIAEIETAAASKAAAAEQLCSVQDAESCARERFASQARSQAAERHVAAARVALDAAKAAESAAINSVVDLTQNEVGPEIREAIDRACRLYDEWQSAVANVLGAEMLGLLPKLTLEEWRLCGGVASPTAAKAGIALQGPPLTLGDNWSNGTSLRAMAFTARNAWSERLAALAEQPAPAPVADAMLVGPALTAAALQAVDRRDPVQFAP